MSSKEYSLPSKELAESLDLSGRREEQYKDGNIKAAEPTKTRLGLDLWSWGFARACMNGKEVTTTVVVQGTASKF